MFRTPLPTLTSVHTHTCPHSRPPDRDDLAHTCASLTSPPSRLAVAHPRTRLQCLRLPAPPPHPPTATTVFARYVPIAVIHIDGCNVAACSALAPMSLCTVALVHDCDDHVRPLLTSTAHSRAHRTAHAYRVLNVVAHIDDRGAVACPVLAPSHPNCHQTM
ncbi:hypothetical protein EIP86_004417 [Pleurotus ostreatoroseus]|nr:hypothetical protein EIP86_004417 [Pleurotus ostreatoroseus]